MSNRHRLATVAFGAVYLGGTAFNLVFTVPDAQAVFESFRDMAWLGPYRWVIDHVILSAATPSAIALVAFELTVGVGILAQGRARQAALAAATAFVVGLIPSIGWPYWTANVAVAAAQAAFLRRTWK